MRSSLTNSRIFFLAALFVVLWWAPFLWAFSPAPGGQAQFDQLLEDLRAFKPKQALDRLAESNLPGDIRFFIQGWAYHQLGDYVKAEAAFQKVDPEHPELGGYLVNRLNELKKTASTLKQFQVLETENFSIRFQPGRDEVLNLFLPEILEQAYTHLSKAFHYRRDDKIIVEIMPDHELFSYASALTRQQIETTGTIALCVENRLVVLTPRRVAQGYFWPDVISHEFVHYILTKLSEDNVPLWMQEGVAKYFETNWRGSLEKPLDPMLETSLAKGLAAKRYVTVEEMHPSFAAMPTAELAQLAYAQVTSWIDFLVKSQGKEIVRDLVVSLKDTELPELLPSKIGMDFQSFQEEWKDWAAKQHYKAHADTGHLSVSLLDEDGGTESIGNLADSESVSVKHLRLGDLLLERNRYKAALKQYDKALAAAEKAPDRQMVLRLLTCYEHLDRFEDLNQVIERHVKHLDADVTMLVYKANAAFNLERFNDANDLLRQALFINPFNPGVHELGVRVYRRLGNSEALRKAEEAMQILQQRASENPPKPKKETKS